MNNATHFAIFLNYFRIFSYPIKLISQLLSLWAAGSHQT